MGGFCVKQNIDSPGRKGRHENDVAIGFGHGVEDHQIPGGQRVEPKDPGNVAGEAAGAPNPEDGRYEAGDGANKGGDVGGKSETEGSENAIDVRETMFRDGGTGAQIFHASCSCDQT